MTNSNRSEDIRIEAVAAALRARDPKKAAALAEFDLAQGVQHPILFNARALWLAENARHVEALEDFRSAARLAPGNPAIWSAEGVCLTMLNRFDEAVEAFSKAIALHPNSALLHCRIGWAHEQARNLVAARNAYLRALEIDAQNAEALGRLAQAAARQGAWNDARDYADRALRADPAQPSARFATVTADIHEGRLEQAEGKLIALLGDVNLSDINRVSALGQLGDLRDRQGRIDEAFQAYSQANQASHGLPMTVTTAGGVSMPQLIAMLAAHFAAKEPLPAPAQPRPARKYSHVFLLGFMRSGTTLLEQVLASHRDVVTLEEKGLISGALQNFMASPQSLDALARAPEAVLDTWRDEYWRQVRKHGVDPANKTFVDKGPFHTVDIPVIARLFPDAKIVFAMRDPRDVVLSCFCRRFALNSTTVEFLTLESTAQCYDGVMRLAEIYRAVLPVDLYEMRHERLVDDFETETRDLCTALGREWDAAMLNFADRSKLGAISTISAAQISRGLNRDGVRRWRRYAGHLAPVMPVLEPWVAKFGYAQ